jgi:hypothetical protein
MRNIAYAGLTVEVSKRDTVHHPDGGPFTASKAVIAVSRGSPLGCVCGVVGLVGVVRLVAIVGLVNEVVGATGLVVVVDAVVLLAGCDAVFVSWAAHAVRPITSATANTATPLVIECRLVGFVAGEWVGRFMVRSSVRTGPCRCRCQVDDADLRRRRPHGE